MSSYTFVLCVIASSVLGALVGVALCWIYGLFEDWE